MYRDGLALRRKALSSSDLAWQDAPAGMLVFDRGPAFRCTVNLGTEPVRFPSPGQLLLASGPIGGNPGPGEVELPPDTTAWWQS
jgi:alpha-glucosidase